MKPVEQFDLVNLLRLCAETMRLMDEALEHANIETPIGAYPLMLENRCKNMAEALDKWDK